MKHFSVEPPHLEVRKKNQPKIGTRVENWALESKLAGNEIKAKFCTLK